MPKRHIQDVPLPPSPRLRRAPKSRGGHVLYTSGAISLCSRHKLCAYTGTEKDRCPLCHALADRPSAGCEGEHGVLPLGRSRPCYCRGCDELFSSNSAFDHHQTSRGCHDPVKRGLVLVEKGGWLLWAFPGEAPPR